MIQSLLQALPFLLQTGPGIKAGYKGVDLKAQKKSLDQMNQMAGQQARLAAAQTDMNNPLFQSIYGQERQAGQDNLAETIAEISRQNRRLTSMGRQPLLDQERGGESVFRNLMKGQQDVGNQARQNTFNILKQGQNAYGSAQDAYGGIYKGQADQAAKGFQNDIYGTFASHSLGQTLQKLFGLGNQTQQPEKIVWNQPSTPQGWQTIRGGFG